MPRYDYSAIDAEGRATSGTVVAEDLTSAALWIRARDCVPTNIQRVSAASDAAPADLGLVASAQALDALLPRGPVGPKLPADEERGSSGRVSPGVEVGPATQAVGHGGHASKVDTCRNGVLGGAGAARAEAGDASVSGDRGSDLATRAGRVRAAADARSALLAERSGLFERLRQRVIYPATAGYLMKHAVAFYRQTAALIRAGFPLSLAMSHLEADASSARLRGIAGDAARQIQAGGKFSTVMAGYPGIFPPLHLELVRAAEEAGILHRILDEIAASAESELEMRRLISRETLYPKLVLTCQFVLIPGLFAMMLGRNPLGALVFTVGFLLAAWLFVLVAVGLYRAAYFNSATLRNAVDRLKLSIPWLGGMVRMFVAARFMRTVAALYRAGLPMGACFRRAGASCGSSVLEEKARVAGAKVDAGGSLALGVAETNFFPNNALQMFGTGEITGDLDALLDNCAQFYEAEAKTKLHQAAVLFGNLLLLLVGLEIVLGLRR